MIERELDDKNSDEVSFEAKIKIASAQSAFVCMEFNAARKIIDEAVKLNHNNHWDESRELLLEIIEAERDEKIYQNALEQIRIGNFSDSLSILDDLNQRVGSDVRYAYALGDLKEYYDFYIEEVINELSNPREVSYSKLDQLLIKNKQFEVSNGELYKPVKNLTDSEIWNYIQKKIIRLTEMIMKNNTIIIYPCISLQEDIDDMQKTKQLIDAYLEFEESYYFNQKFIEKINLNEIRKFVGLYEKYKFWNDSLNYEISRIKNKKNLVFIENKKVIRKLYSQYPHDQRMLIIREKCKKTLIWLLLITLIGVIIILFLILIN